MWNLPEIDLFATNPVLKRYRGRPPGNIPELCNSDSCSNEDLHKSVDYHVRYTHSLHKLDPKTCSIATPKKGTPSYLHFFFQLTASLHQAKVSYPTCMMYSNQSSTSWRPMAELSQMSRL